MILRLRRRGSICMRHEFIHAVSGALFALALIALEKLLPFSEPYNILVACAVGAVGFAAFFALFLQFRHSRMLRHHLGDDLQAFEGDWLEEWCDGDKPRYSIATIRFDNKAKTYFLTGNAYDKDAQTVAHWKSHHLF